MEQQAALWWLRAETPADAHAVGELIERAFGPGRYAKAAQRLREGSAPRLDLSRLAEDAGAIVGAVRLWPIRIGETQALLLGPIAVEAGRRSQGVGAELMRAAVAAADAACGWPVLLVGDLSYFGRFGFVRAPAEVVMPGPVEPRRVLVRGAPRDLAGAARKA